MRTCSGFGGIMAVVLIGLYFPLVAGAQLGPVQLTVTKLKNTSAKTKTENTGDYRNRRRAGSTSTTRTVAGESSVAYHVELAAKGIPPQGELTVKWAVLVKTAKKSDPVVHDGEHACTVALSQKSEFDTDAFDLGKDDELLGYSVEVFAAGKLITSDVQPATVRAQIQQAKSKQADAPQPGNRAGR